MTVGTIRCMHGVVPKGLLTFLGSLYQEVAKTTSGALVCRFERQTARKKKKKKKEEKNPSKNTVSSTENVGFYPRNLQRAIFCI